MLPPVADRPKLARTLDGLAASVEELLQSGLTTASESTRETLNVAMQEAARARLLRLGSTLRASAEELGRFARQDPNFSRRRLTFFLNRSWLLSRGLAHALHAGDASEYDRLAWNPTSEPLPAVEAVCLGVVKRASPGSFVAFEFRLRALADAGPIPGGGRLAWSTVFPARPGVEIPPEGFLHLPQKQRFTPTVFLDGAPVTITEAAITLDDSGGGRLTLTDGSKVTAGTKRFDGWSRFHDWSPGPALERLARHTPGPLDVETELQEEIVLRDYKIGAPAEGDEPGQLAYEIEAGPLAFKTTVSAVDGQALAKSLNALRKPKAKRPPLFGLMHYERGRLVLQPLATLGDEGPAYLTISTDKVDRAALLKTLSFK